MSIPVLSPIPQPPATTDPENFNTRADAFLAALPRLQQELNTAVAALNPLVPDLPGLTSIANNLESIRVAEANIAHVQATSANIASVVAVVDNSVRINAVANNAANINTVAANSTPVAVAAENIADILAAPSAATAAAMSARAAEAAQAGAEAAKAGAETAQAGAETAKAGAETAKTGADVAQAAAEVAKAGAEKARDEAQVIVGGYYVTVDTEQTVTAKKTFTGGIVGDVEGNAATATLAAQATLATQAVCANSADSVPWGGVTGVPETFQPAAHDHINITGNAGTATKLQSPRNIALSGAVYGSANFDGSGNISIYTNSSAGGYGYVNKGSRTTSGSWSITGCKTDKPLFIVLDDGGSTYVKSIYVASGAVGGVSNSNNFRLAQWSNGQYASFSTNVFVCFPAASTVVLNVDLPSGSKFTAFN